MKQILALLSCLFVISCTAQKKTLSTFMAIYSNNWSGETCPTYIILRTHPHTFEIYAPSIDESIFGQWIINKDTLYLSPKFECFSRKSELRVNTQLDTSIATVPQVFVINKDGLIDITDYRGILPEPFDIQNYKPVYKRIKTAF